MCVRVLNLCIPSVQDITPRETVRQAPKCDRDVTLYGFLRGTNMKPGARVHVAGVGDYTIQVCWDGGGTSRCGGLVGVGSMVWVVWRELL